QWRAFDADRPDFNGALAQFAIGLLQTTTPVDSPIEWRRCFNNPPSGDTLRQWFAPVTEAFVFDGDGPRFMQDLTLRSDDAKPLPIADLLIDTPSEDRALFVKRRASMKFCAACAASATLTLQINSPEGGRGHFTGIRGGGPLTTLVWGSPEGALWTSLWRNVRFDRARAGGQSAPSDQSVFPWLATIDKLRAHGGEITSAQAHEMHVFWAMPRRVWIEFHNADQPDQCGVCGRSSISLVGSYRTRPYGLKYPSECWAHPLTPYRLNCPGFRRGSFD
ncbi:MAG: type I-E CRISPR-associated protein Cse1/CasA, partial [Rubrivivax sp.]|nr:type I-E CRISPR-associated protein Cse1/CasA [Rubrivivax sp.]